MIPAERGGAIRESIALGKAYAEARRNSGNEFIEALVSPMSWRAAKEGGTLGIGGKEVTEQEQAALDELRRQVAGAGG